MSTGHEVDKSSIYRICIKVTLNGKNYPNHLAYPKGPN